MWEDAAPILRMARAPLDGRDQGADRGVLRGHLNQIKGFFLFTSSAKGDLQALLLLSLLAALICSFSTPFRGSPRREEFRLLLALALIRGMVEVEIGVARTASIKSNGSAAIVVSEMIHI